MSAWKIISQNRRPLLMLLAMFSGVVLYRPLSMLDDAAHGLLAPACIFIMLFVSFCKVRLRDLRLSWLHILLIIFQVVSTPLVYYMLMPLGSDIAQGGMICFLAPVAMGAVAVVAILGANIITLISYTLICNLVMTLMIPLYLNIFGNGECDFSQILWRVLPLLLIPMLLSQGLKYSWSKGAVWVGEQVQASFYLWIGSVSITLARTARYIVDDGINLSFTDLLILGGVALVACLIQFQLGHIVGRRFGEEIVGGQSLGQKNTVLAVWLAQSFLSPTSSLIPTAYIIWQNLINSIQIYRHDRSKRGIEKG